LHELSEPIRRGTDVRVREDDDLVAELEVRETGTERVDFAAQVRFFGNDDSKGDVGNSVPISFARMAAGSSGSSATTRRRYVG